MSDLQEMIDETVGELYGYAVTADELKAAVMALAEAAKDLDPISQETLKVTAAMELRHSANFSDTKKLLNLAFKSVSNEQE